MAKPKHLRGQVYMCDLGETKGNVQGGTRPVVIVQNNYGNEYSPTLIVAPITSKPKNTQPTHLTIELHTKSTILTEQIMTVPKSSLKGKPMYYLGSRELLMLDQALKSSLQII